MVIEELESVVAPDAMENAEHFVIGALAGASFVLAIAALTGC